MDAADRQLFERGLRHALAEHEGAGLAAALDELGWSDALELEPETAVPLLFELQGTVNASSRALEELLASTGGVAHAPGTRVLVPSIGAASAPGALDQDRCAIRGLLLGGLSAEEQVIVVASDGPDRHRVLKLPVAELELRAVEGMDPELGLVELSGEHSLERDAATFEEVDWERMVSRARLALGFELVGASRAMLELARAHALERVQFGVPIASFQAVRHRLAEVLIGIESSSALLAAAWEDASPLSASLAKAYAGRSARAAAAHCQQVLAGMGFTAEHPFHHHFRRVILLEQLFGSSTQLTRQLGEQLLVERGVPALFPL